MRKHGDAPPPRLRPPCGCYDAAPGRVFPVALMAPLLPQGGPGGGGSVILDTGTCACTHRCFFKSVEPAGVDAHDLRGEVLVQRPPGVWGTAGAAAPSPAGWPLSHLAQLTPLPPPSAQPLRSLET